LNEPPALRGYLSKYTNVAKGYATRWFVLKNGVLSCTHILVALTRFILIDIPFIQTTAIKKTKMSPPAVQYP
jgi:hypothetical protein